VARGDLIAIWQQFYFASLAHPFPFPNATMDDPTAQSISSSTGSARKYLNQFPIILLPIQLIVHIVYQAYLT
jgi:hypothetical protein